MMKKLNYIFVLLSLCMVTSVSAQSVKPQEATMDDYLPLLQASGYQVYSFDISEFLNDTYHFSFKIKEYVNREEVQAAIKQLHIPIGGPIYAVVSDRYLSLRLLP